MSNVWFQEGSHGCGLDNNDPKGNSLKLGQYTWLLKYIGWDIRGGLFFYRGRKDLTPIQKLDPQKIKKSTVTGIAKAMTGQGLRQKQADIKTVG